MQAMPLQVTWGFGIVGGSIAIVIGQANTILLLAAYVVVSGKQATVWGRPTRAALQVIPETVLAGAASKDGPCLQLAELC